MSEQDVNAQHLAAMGVDPDSLGNPATPEEIRCTSSHPEHPTRRCVRKTGHAGWHARGGDSWEDTTVPEPTKQREGDQRLPDGAGECVQDVVIEAMQASKKVGVERYGQTLRTFNGRKGLLDLVEELRDAFVYGSLIQREAEADRETLVAVVAQALADVKNLPEWMRAPALGESLTPVAEVAVDRIMGWVVSQRMEQAPTPRYVFEILRGWRDGGVGLDFHGEEVPADVQEYIAKVMEEER